MGWSEAIDLIRIIRADPSSQLVASIEGWSHPLSREGWMLADLIDIQGSKALGKKWNLYPRPTKPTEATRRGNAAGRDPEEIKAILRTQFGQQNEQPD